jgi:hypothetical protein
MTGEALGACKWRKRFSMLFDVACLRSMPRALSIPFLCLYCWDWTID